MCELLEIEYLDIPEDENYKKKIEEVLKQCYKEENIEAKYLYVNIILTNPENIRKLNKEYRNINKETDVLSFPMFEKKELENFKSNCQEVLGDIVISIEKVQEQALEYGHSFERELSYMLVHGFYHLMGYDHIIEEDKVVMRKKEEEIMDKLGLTR